MTVVVDADVLIGALDASDSHHRVARALFTEWHRSGTAVVVSAVNLSEVLVAPSADRQRLRQARTAIATLGVAVHGSGSDSFTIYNVNNSSSSLDNIVVAVGGTDPTEFNVATGCTAATPCSIPMFGTPITIPVTFLPTVHGLEDATITVTSNGGSASVSLFGTGYGAVMALGSASINFGTVGLGQTVPRTVNVENHGNYPQMPFSVGSAAPPYGISPGSGNVGQSFQSRSSE